MSLYQHLIPRHDNKTYQLQKFARLGSDVGLLFQITDDLLDHQGNMKRVGKKTRKDIKKGKATLISLLCYKITINYSLLLKKKIFKQLKIFKKRSNDLKDTLELVASRKK